MSSKWSVQSHSDGVTREFTVSGYLDEHAQFPPPQGEKLVKINLKTVTGINSVGTRTWCEWLRLFSPYARLELYQCPMMFVRAFNQVLGAYPKNAWAMSFYVPFVNDDTGERADVLVTEGRHYTWDGPVLMPKVHDAGGNPMEMDVDMNYFGFLRR